ncbi:hypothetical protein P5V15_000153 [Pogonomyrmex californicus]
MKNKKKKKEKKRKPKELKENYINRNRTVTNAKRRVRECYRLPRSFSCKAKRMLGSTFVTLKSTARSEIADLNFNNKFIELLKINIFLINVRGSISIIFLPRIVFENLNQSRNKGPYL